MLRALIIILVACSFTGCTDTLPSEFGAEVGALAPPIIAQSVDGQKVNLSDLKGQYVILEFYASWCGPCHRELPKLKALYTEKASSGNPVEVISIALEKNKETGSKFLAQVDFPWSKQILQEARYVRFDPIASDYNVTDIPASFLIGPDGKVLAAHSSIAQIQSILDSL